MRTQSFQTLMHNRTAYNGLGQLFGGRGATCQSVDQREKIKLPNLRGYKYI